MREVAVAGARERVEKGSRRRKTVGAQVPVGALQEGKSWKQREAREIRTRRRKELNELKGCCSACCCVAKYANGGRRSTEEEAQRARAFWSSSQKEKEGPSCPLAKIGRCSSSCCPREMGEIPKWGRKMISGPFLEVVVCWKLSNACQLVKRDRGEHMTSDGAHGEGATKSPRAPPLSRDPPHSIHLEHTSKYGVHAERRFW